MKVVIKENKRIYNGFINLDRAVVQFEKFDGSLSRPVSRLNVYRGDAVAILLYHSAAKRVYFVRQFRYPIFTVEPDNAWPLEVVAGSVEGQDNPTQTAIREVEEEAGFQIREDQLVTIGRCYPSPGGTSERIILYAADVADSPRHSHGGGLSEEEEDIQVVELSFQETLDRLKTLEFKDAKTLLTLYWLCDQLTEADIL